MAMRSGGASQFGVADETTWGTFVSPTRFLPFTSLTGTHDVMRVESNDIYAGELLQNSRSWTTGHRKVGFELKMDLTQLAQAKMWYYALGSVGTTPLSPDFLHLIQMANTRPGFSAQVGVPRNDGTVEPFNYHGCMVQSAALEFPMTGPANATFNVVAEDVQRTTPVLGAATYATGNKPLSVPRLTVTNTALTGVSIRSLSYDIQNNLEAEPTDLQSELIKEPAIKDLAVITANATIEFQNRDAYDAYVNGSEQSFRARLDQAGTGNHYFEVDMNARFDGSLPNVTGRDKVVMDLPLKAIKPESGTDFLMRVQNSDAAA